MTVCPKEVTTEDEEQEVAEEEEGASLTCGQKIVPSLHLLHLRLRLHLHLHS